MRASGRRLIAIGASALAAWCALAGPARAASGEGTLYIATDGAREGPPPVFPLQRTEVSAHVVGFTAQVAVRQVFNNPFDEPLEAIYVFPLPEDAAVGAMTIAVGDRTIKGTIEERAEARATYERAKREGYTAALLDQERPNVFTQSVANIAPHQEVRVEIVYDVALAYDDGEYEFVYPMVVGPRYVPGTPNGEAPAGHGRSPDTDEVPDASKITPPVRPKRRSGGNIAIDVTLDPGAPIGDIDSPTHDIEVVRPRGGETAVRVSLAGGKTIPNKDLVVRYRLAPSDKEAEPVVAVSTYRAEDGGYFAMLVEPPAKPRARDVRPKELYFVVDTSGSMKGQPLDLAKRAMRHAIEHLGPDDTFQIIRFSGGTAALADAPLANDRESRARAAAFIDGLTADGGTEMMNGVRAALASDDGDHRLRVVVFMTDGFIGNETHVLAEVAKSLDDRTRLFAFGVGSSPNRYLLDRMAEAGRGDARYLLLTEDPVDQVRSFYERIRAPVVTDLEIDWGGLDVKDVSPRAVPDLFAGQPLRVVGRFGRSGSGTVKVRGTGASGPVAFEVPVTFPARASSGHREALGRLWARARIRELMGKQLHEPTYETEVAVTRLALEHGLVSRYTSFVAVEERVVNESGRSKTVMVPVELPAGVEWSGVVGDRDGDRDGVRDAADVVPEMVPRGGAGGSGGGGAAGPDSVERAHKGAERRYETGVAADRAPTTDAAGGDYDDVAETAAETVVVRAIERRNGWRFGVTVGGGAAFGDVEDGESRGSGLAGARGNRLVLGGNLSLGAHVVFVLPRFDSDASAGNVMFELALPRLFSGWLELFTGIGPGFAFSGDVGVGLTAGLQLNLPFPGSVAPSLQFRYDAIEADETEADTLNIGIQLGF